jgi:pyrroloquinoline quinone biosynthesis protein B
VRSPSLLLFFPDMHVKILGSAAGGGFPQWNCACKNCRRLRAGTFAGTPRAQAQLALATAPGTWTLINASPDLRAQIEATPELWPQDTARDSPIRDVVLTGAEVDQVLGLLLLREFHSFRIHATAAVRKILVEDNTLFGVLARFPGQISWNDMSPARPFSVGSARLEVLPLPGTFPGFVRASRVTGFNSSEAVIGLWIAPESGGKALMFIPGAACIPDPVFERLKASDVLLFDGTFWSDGEPTRIPGVSRTARQMGHLPISGAGGSLERLAKLTRPRKIFIHINNTNPILDEESPEYRMVGEAGWEVARDGMEIAL